MARRLQVGQQVARVLRAVVAAVGDALVAAGLGARDLVGVLDAAAHEAHRQLVRQVAARTARGRSPNGSDSGGPNISSSRGLGERRRAPAARRRRDAPAS